MKIAIITDDGETPIRSEDLADEITKRVGPLTTRGAIRKAIADIEQEVRLQTLTLGPEHR